MNLLLDSSAIGWSIIAMIVLLVALIYGFRYHFSKRRQQKQFSQEDTTILSRNKYTEVNAFKWSNTFLRIGMITALSFVVLAFNWTTFDAQKIGDIDLDIVEDILETDPPRTFDPPKPPPPPPPPPVIVEVPEEEIEEEPTFIDQSVEEEEIIALPPDPKPSEVVAPKPILPPPPDPDDGGTVSIFAEQMPRFPGCDAEAGDNKAKKTCADKKMLQFLSKNIDYPAIARENGIQGTAVIRFIVEKDGSLSGFEVVKDPGGGLGKEALRVVALMNNMDEKWSPGKQNARPVRVQFNLPVRFRLQ